MGTIKIFLVSYHPIFLDRFIEKFKKGDSSFNQKAKIFSLPSSSKTFTVLRSVFVNKKSREQFKLETHVRLIVIKSTPSLKILEFLTKNPSSGIAIKITIEER